MFKIEVSEEDRARFEEKRAREAVVEQAREWAIEQATSGFYGEGGQGDLLGCANRIYDYVFGARS